MNKTNKRYTIGLISDTHGLLRSEVLESFHHTDLILHAGDIGGPEVLEKLTLVAPVVAVRGNMDYGVWAESLPDFRRLKFGEKNILLIHDMSALKYNPGENGYDVVVSGHTHRPLVEKRHEILFVNPGSAGYRCRTYPVTIGRLLMYEDSLNAELIELES